MPFNHLLEIVCCSAEGVGVEETTERVAALC